MPSHFSVRESLPVYSEDDCAGALFAGKWPDGFRCPRCAHPQYYAVTSRGRRLFECRSCAHQTSLTTGTILEGTRTPLVKWFQAMYLMQFGISAVLLAELIVVTYKTAWLMNHKLRHAIGAWDRDRPLEGDLQLLGEYYGYEYHRHFSSRTAQEDLKPQPVVIGASLNEAKRIVHLKMKVVDGPEGCAATGGVKGNEDTTERFIRQHVAGVTSPAHAEMLEPGHRGQAAPHVAWREAVRWMAWTFGGIGPKHLQAYLNEFCCRRLCRNDMLAELIASCGSTRTITYRALVGARAGIRPLKWGHRHRSRSAWRAG